MRTSLVASLTVAALAVAGAPVPAMGQTSGPVCTVPDASFLEGDGGTHAVSLRARCDAPLLQELEYHVATADGTADAPDDYVALDTTRFANAGLTEFEVALELVGDTSDEADETFTVTLDAPSGGVTFARPTATVTIVDDDGPTGPCVLLSETAVSVGGTASTPSTPRFAGPLPRITMTNCGDSDTNLNVRGTHATGAGGTWQLTNASSGGPIDSTCDLGVDLFRADVTLWNSQGGGFGTPLTTQDRPLLGEDLATPFVLAAAAAQEFSPSIELPCVGSIGLGDPMTMDITLTAVAP